MKLFAKSFLLLAMFMTSTVHATLNGGTAKIEKILFYEGGNLIYIYPEGGVQNAPSCHGSNGDYISYSVSRPMAKEYLSGLMSAFIARKSVSFWIDENCVDQSISSTLSYFIVNK